MRSMIPGVIAIVTGSIAYLRADHTADRIRTRMSEGDDRFFEEQRTYRSYPILSNPRRIRASGVALVMVGLGYIAALVLFA